MVAMAMIGCGMSNSPKTSITPTSQSKGFHKMMLVLYIIPENLIDNLMTIPMCKSETLAGILNLL